MVKKVKGDLILKKDLFIEDDLIVHGSIFGKDDQRYNLIVKGSIEAKQIRVGLLHAVMINSNEIEAEKIVADSINCRTLESWNIESKHIDTYQVYSTKIDTYSLSADNVHADIVICEKFLPKNNNSKITAKIFFENRLTIPQKTWLSTQKVFVT